MTDSSLSEKLRANYDDYYQSEDPKWRWLGAIHKADNIIRMCRELPHDSIVDIGAGDGSILQRLSDLRFGTALHALEVSRSGVAAIEARRIAQLHTCAVFDGYRIPHDNDTFDLAVMSHVLEHVEHPRQLINEAARVAKCLFIEVPLLDTGRVPADFVFDEVGHINFYSPRTLRWLVQTCDLEVLQQSTSNPSKAVHAYIGDRKGAIRYYVKQAAFAVAPALATRLFCYHGALVCRKAVAR